LKWHKSDILIILKFWNNFSFLTYEVTDLVASYCITIVNCPVAFQSFSSFFLNKLIGNISVLQTVRTGLNSGGSRVGTVLGGPNSKKSNPSHRWPPGVGTVRFGPFFFTNSKNYEIWKINLWYFVNNNSLN
jgi:hypothetical protein